MDLFREGHSETIGHILSKRPTYQERQNGRVCARHTVANPCLAQEHISGKARNNTMFRRAFCVYGVMVRPTLKRIFLSSPAADSLLKAPSECCEQSASRLDGDLLPTSAIESIRYARQTRRVDCKPDGESPLMLSG